MHFLVSKQTSNKGVGSARERGLGGTRECVDVNEKQVRDKVFPLMTQSVLRLIFPSLGLFGRGRPLFP